MDNQVGSLRKRWVIGSYEITLREGTYFGIRSDITSYKLADPLPCPFDKTMALANTPTRLKGMDQDLRQKLVNWGYAICDAAMRKHVSTGATRGVFLYPIGVG